MMLRHIFEHAMEQTHLQRTMIEHAHMMLAAALCGQLQMRAGLRGAEASFPRAALRQALT